MSQTLSKILNAYPEHDFVIAKGFNEAAIGVDLDSGRLVYSVGKCIDVLVYVDNMAIEDAEDYFQEHVMTAYDKESGPIWVNTEF